MVVWESLDALSHQLELCDVDADTRVVVVLGPTVSHDRAALIRAAVARTGADAIEVRSVYTMPNAAGEQSLLAAVTSRADLVIATHALPSDPTTGSDCQLLHLGDIEPRDFAPHANLMGRTNRLRALVQNGLALELSDPHGTRLRIELTNSLVSADHGIVSADQPVASFPAGWVAAVPTAGSVNGDVVIMPGDTNLTSSRTISSPVRLQIVNDHVSVIDGDNPDADVIRAQFEYAGQPGAYGIAEITLGMNPGLQQAAAFDARLLDPRLSRLMAGVVTMSFGDNLHADRPCDQRVTLALAGRSMAVDGLPVCTLGQLAGDFAPDVYEL